MRPATLLLLFAACAAEPGSAPPPGAPAPMGWTGVLDEQEFAALHELEEAAAPPPLGEMVQVGKDRHYLSLPRTGRPPFPALVVVHEWWGLNGHMKHWTDRLAADGYAALAVDLYGGKVARTREEAQAALQAVDAAAAKATLHRAFEFLGTDPRIQASRRGSIGWCFGGGWSLELALMEPRLDAAVIYYGRLVTDVGRLSAIRAPVLGIFGNRDRGIPPSSVDAFAKAMAAAGRECRIERYDADHAFANPSGQRYDQEHAAAAWAEVRAFLAGKLKPGA